MKLLTYLTQRDVKDYGDPDIKEEQEVEREGLKVEKEVLPRKVSTVQGSLLLASL